MEREFEYIDLKRPPHRFNSLSEVVVWHTRTVLPDCIDYEEAAVRLGVTTDYLKNLKDKYEIAERPYGERDDT